MSRSDWVHDAALGGLVVFVLGVFALASYPTSKQGQTYSQHRCSQQKSAYASAATTRYNQEQAATSEQSAGKARDDKDHDPDWCDLAAQESMAKSTVGMERAAWASVLLSVVGIILLGFTLYWTFRAARASDEMLGQAIVSTKAAVDAAEAALTSVSIAEKSMAVDQRAWLVFENVRLGPIYKQGPHILVQVSAVAVNTGRTPTRKLAIGARVFHMFDNRRELLQAFIDDTSSPGAISISGSALGPNERRPISFGTVIQPENIIPTDQMGEDRYFFKIFFGGTYNTLFDKTVCFTIQVMTIDAVTERKGFRLDDLERGPQDVAQIVLDTFML